jgi:formylglycine-generating enzyme required for sulfatase activity
LGKIQKINGHPTMSEKTVFISYRRDAAGKAFARSVKEALTHHGYDAFLDVDDIAAGYWAKQILTQVPQRAHFLLLVTPGALDKCAKQNDWVRREFELAKASDRNIVPVFEESVNLVKLRKECPSSMQGIFDFQGLTLRHGEFEYGIETLISRYIPPHKASAIGGQVNEPPVDIKPHDDNKPSILLIALLILTLVALAVGLVIIIKSSLFDADSTVPTPFTSTTPKPPESITLVLDDVNEIQADNTHVIKLSPPDKKHLSRLTNMSGEREQFTLINFPHNIFYTNVEDEDHSINAGESKSLRLILTALAPESKEYPFEIRSIKHKESIHVSIHLEGDWKVYHQQQLADFAEKTKELKTKEQVYQAALQVIDKENPDLVKGPKQALLGQFLVNAGKTDAAVLAFAEADKSVPKTLERLVFADSPTIITALGKHYEASQDYAKAANWLTAAAKMGEAEAEYSLGQLYETGNGVKQDKSAAQAWYRKAAAQGHPAAMQSIGSKDESKPLNPSKSGASSQDCPICPEMVEIPAGSFIMGGYSEADEKPRHRVEIAAFKLGKFEVTQAQWKAVTGSNTSSFSDCGDECPVEVVSWYDVQTFIQKLNAQTGGGYRLPSEAEWEYACRAGQDTLYCGSDDPVAVAWFALNSKDKIHPVGARQPNAFGLYDMSGNVWEWVQDCYHHNYQGAPTNGSAWDDGADCGPNRRVVRGGSWYSRPGSLRSANRHGDDPGDRYYTLGFRLAQDL